MLGYSLHGYGSLYLELTISLMAGLFKIILFFLILILITGILDPKCGWSNKPIARLECLCSRDPFLARWFMRSVDMARSRPLA